MSRTPESLSNTLAAQLQVIHHHKLVLGFDAILVMGPEHARVFADAGWDRDRILFELHMRLTTPAAELERGAGGIAEGIPVGMSTADLPKFRPDDVLDAIETERASIFIGVPAMYRMLLQAGAEYRDLTSIRVWGSGADAMPTDLAQRFKEMGATLSYLHPQRENDTPTFRLTLAS